MSDVEIAVDASVEVIAEDRDPMLLEVPAQGPRGPKGDKGDKGDPGANGAPGTQGPGATVRIGAVTTTAPGGAAAVTNSGSDQNAVLDFDIPQGDQGPQGLQGAQGVQGPQGTAATVAVGAVTTGAPGSAAAVNNSGTPGAAVFDFTIPQGPQGAQGPAGADGLGVPAGGATGQVLTKNSGADNDTAWVDPSGTPQGTVVFTIKQAAPAGWLMFNDSTIGNVGSGAGYAAADALATFDDLWAFGDTNAPLFTSAGAATTRAAQTDAATAWAAGCRMSMPKVLGRALAAAGAGSGLTSRALGDFAGAETVSLTSAMQASMSLSGSASVSVSGSISGTASAKHGDTNYAGSDYFFTSQTWTGASSSIPVTGTFSGSGSGSISGSASGGGGSHPNMQPTAFLNVMVKK